MVACRAALFPLAFLICGAALHAQDVPLPTNSPTPAAAGSPASPAPAASSTPAPRPPDLIPPDILPPPDPAAPVTPPSLPTIPQLDEATNPNPVSEAQRQYDLHVEWRKARNVAENDPAVRAALAIAQRAPTDLEKRRLLARYYEIFYAKAAASASAEFRKYLMDRKREALGALPQPRVRPDAQITPAPKKQP